MNCSRIFVAMMLAILTLSGGLLAQDSLNVSGLGVLPSSWDWPGPMVKVGNYLYAGTYSDRCGLIILDVTNPALPVEAGRLYEPVGVRAIETAGTYLYCSTVSAGLTILDIADPVHPAVVGVVGDPSQYSSLKIAMPYLYRLTWALTPSTPALEIYDLSNPAAPTLVSTFEAPSLSAGVAHVDVAGSRAYLLALWGALYIVDVSNPAAPVLMGNCSLDIEEAMSVAVAGNYAYVAGQGQGFFVVDVSDPAAPVQVASIPTRDWAIDIELNGNYAYVADDIAGLSIVDITNPVAPQLLGQYATPSWAEAITFAAPYIYLSDIGHGMMVVDPADPNSPVRIGEYCNRSLSSIAVAGTHAFISSLGPEPTVTVADISNPAHPTETTRITMPAELNRVAISGNYLFGISDYGMVAVDIANPTVPSIVGNLDFGMHEAMGIEINGNHAYVGMFENLFEVMDISDPAALQVVGSCTIPGYVYNLTSNGSFAYVLYESGLAVVDASTPAAPIMRGTIPVVGDWAVAAGGYVYVNGTLGGIRGLHVVDVTNPDEPVLACQHWESWTATGMYAARGYLFVTTLGDGLRVFDIHDPAAPEEVGFYDPYRMMGFSTQAVTVSGDLVYVVGSDGLSILQTDFLGAPPAGTPPAHDFALRPAYPNPFNSSTRISFSLPAMERIELSIYDVLGREVQRLAQGIYTAGEHELTFEGRDLTSGMYFIRLTSPRHTATQKLMLLK